MKESVSQYSMYVPIVFGWLLGLATIWIKDIWTKRYKRKTLRGAFIAELECLCGKIILVCSVIQSRSGRRDETFLSWFIPLLKKYKKSELSQEEIATLDAGRLDGIRLSELLYEAKPNRALSLRKYSLPFLRSNLSDLQYFEVSFTEELLRIAESLNAVNELIDESRYHYQLTFDASLSEENHDTVCANLEGNYSRIGRYFQQLANEIDTFVAQYSNPTPPYPHM